MYYKVVKEDCYNGIKNRFSIGQKISDTDISDVKKFFDDNFRTTYEDRKQLKLKYHRLNIFNEKEELYYLILDKIK